MPRDYKVILLKELVILPNQEVKIELVSSISKDTINEAIENFNNKILVVAPINRKEENPNVDDLPKIAVVADIQNKLELSNGNLRITLRGIARLIVTEYYYVDNGLILTAKTENLVLPKFSVNEETAVKRKLKSSLKKYIQASKVTSNSVLNIVTNSKSLNKITDIITVFLPFDIDKKLEYMQLINPLMRGKKLINDLEEEIQILKIEEEIEENLKFKIVQKEKEYFLREKLAEIKEALGETNTKEEEVNHYVELLKSLNLNSKSFNKLSDEIEKYRNSFKESPDSSVIKNYLDVVLNLPWNKTNEEATSINNIKKYLSKSHFGLEEIKERIIEYIEIKNIKGKSLNPIICLVGPPGVGKTTIAKSIAIALNREFIKISVGGLNDSHELIGNRRTYLGANPGKIIQGIKKCNSKNPVILIDEADKMVKDYKGDPASVLLEILDSSFNNQFVDNYIEEPFDLSNVLFILTANNEYDIPYPLLDRLEIFKLNSYTLFEKQEIAKKYIIPKIIKDYELENLKINISNETLGLLINKYTKEAGVRDLERILHKLIRKIIINKYNKPINSTILKEYLGEYKYDEINYLEKKEPGITNFLGYTNTGGIVSKIEVIKIKGTGRVQFTGMIGKSLEESVNVAISYIKANYKTDIANYDLHIHFLEGAIKKDGPSAGTSITTAILSLLLKKAINKNYGFTGEISLKGNILKVGGIKEKVIAAVNNKVTNLYLPYDNKTDIIDCKEYLKNVNIKFVKNYNEIYSDIFK